MKTINHILQMKTDFHKGDSNTGLLNGDKKYLSSKSKPRIKTFLKFSSILNENSAREEIKINNTIIRYLFLNYMATGLFFQNNYQM